MLDLKFILANKDRVQKAIHNKNQSIDLKALEVLDQQRRKGQVEHDSLRARQNEVSVQIPKLKKEKKDTDALMVEMKTVAARLKEIGPQLALAEEQIQELLLGIPNVAHESVPVGTDATSNKELKLWGHPKKLSFKAREHWQLGEEMGIFDPDRATKIAGTRFMVSKGIGARLERALINFMLDLHTEKHGYLEILPPFLANQKSLIGTGMLPKFEDDLFKTREGYYLISTAEVPLTNLHRDEVLSVEQLPLYYTAYTPCFRSEAGAAGKDTRGLIRQHQFNKVELMKYATPETSYDELERLTDDAEEVLQLLELPYRRVLLCTGDMSFSSAKTYDLEVWMPGQNCYREISSCSNFEDYQARRANIRYKAADGKPHFVHTLNGSGLAVGRTVAALMENYQQEDGTVTIPSKLQPYLGGVTVIS